MTKKQYLLIGGSTFLLVLSSWLYSRAGGEVITICVTKDGSVHVVGDSFKRSDCKKNEKLLSWNSQGEKGDKGEQGIQGIQGEKGEKGDKGDSGQNAQQLHLVDANGQDLGILIDGTTPYKTFNTNLNLFINFSVPPQTETVVVGNVEGILFTGSNCTGEPFTTNQPPYVVLTVANQHFASISQSIGSPRPRGSTLFPSGQCDNDPGGVIDKTYLLTPVTLPFTETLALPLEVKSM